MEKSDTKPKLTVAAAEEKAVDTAKRLVKGLQALNEKALSENPELQDMEFEPDYDELCPALASSFAKVLAKYHTIVPPEHAQSPLAESENPEVKRLLDELNDPDTSHKRRATIGDRLAKIGDPRSGVGLRENGLPDFVWCPVPGVEITLEDNAGTFPVNPFYIAKYPVTYSQYRSFLEAKDGYRNTRWWDGLAQRQEEPGGQRWKWDNHPAENMSWYDAVAFCRWLSEKLGHEIRLPTEWEWQEAATGGNAENAYPWGPDWDGSRADTFESNLHRPTAVGLYPQGAAPVSALDMAGNVWEWCLNEHENPSETKLSGDAPRVVRGGSWNDTRAYARAAYRGRSVPAFRHTDLGLRVVSTSPIF